MASRAEKNQLDGIPTGLGIALTNLRLHRVLCRAEAGFHDGVLDYSCGIPIENVGQHAKDDGDSA